MELTPATFALMFEHAEAQGLKLPMYLVAVSSNGQVIAGVLENEGQPCRILCSHITEGGFILPVNVYISDPAGQAIRAVLETSAPEPRWVN